MALSKRARRTGWKLSRKTRGRMRDAKLGVSLPAAHKRAISKGVSAWHRRLRDGR